MNDLVILVDKNDRQIGTKSKLLAHQLGLLHRAFSIFVLQLRENKPYLLLQKRQMTKYHSPGLWTNTCCSHPQPGENIADAATKRLQYEMGFTTTLTPVAQFCYQANFDNGLIEHEYDHVFMGYTEAVNIPINQAEVMDYRWINLLTAKRSFEQQPSQYTPWFPLALDFVIKKLLAEGKNL